MSGTATTDERVARLEKDVERLATERETFRALYMDALEKIKRLEKGLLGQKAERISASDKQLAFKLLSAILGRSDEPEDDLDSEHDESTDGDGEEEEEGDADDNRPPRRKRGRKALPMVLPRVEIEVIPPEVRRLGLDAFKRIGEDTSEAVENRPASKVVVRVVKPKFVRKEPSEDESSEDKTEVLVAETPELPIPRSNAGPGMLADSIVKRWQDHLPLNRLESVYARDGLELSRSTIGGWHMQLGDLVRPLYDAMLADALKQPYLCTDATGVLVQAKERCRNGHFWVLVAPERHVLYRFTAKHNSAAVDSLLKDYKGYLVADAHSVYDHLYTKGNAIEVACWAHCRRYFFKAIGTEPERPQKALGFMKALFAIERSIATAPRKKKEKVRQKKSKPIVEKFFAWCKAEALNALDGTPIAKAFTYALNQREALCRYLDNGQLPMTNNISERALRREAVGRKNWLFVGSEDGGEINALFVTLLASCQLHGLEPWRYLLDLLCLLPRWPKRRVLELAPVNWKKTLEQEETQRRLDANIYRRVALELPIEHPVVG